MLVLKNWANFNKMFTLSPCVHPERNITLGKLHWDDVPERELGDHDGLPDKGRCEQVPDMRSCLSSGAMEQGSS